MDLATMLDDCLQRMAAGEDFASCLARYPEQADELAPLLATAARLRPLSGVRLPASCRESAKATLRQSARLAQAQPPRRFWPGFLARPAGRALAGATAGLLLVVMAITTVAASHPGDPSYAVRLLAEQGTVLLHPSAGGKVAAGLELADRRLAELETQLVRSGRVDQTALAALLAEDEKLASYALTLPAAQRLPVAERVAGHANALKEMAGQAAGPRVTEALSQAAERAEAQAGRIRQGQPAQLSDRPGESIQLPLLSSTSARAAPLKPGARPTPTLAASQQAQ